ncbi:MAG: AarF/ABC1/UbiB kinase family protein [Myxococcales bacterium]|nr:AarF/ABC1/UbiB kinase family protein [Myxococcales bacterium]
MAVGGLSEKAKRLVRQGRDSVPPLLTVANARMVADRLSRLRGAAMKLGQMLSMEGEHLLPAEFADALARLRAGADAMPAAQVWRVMETAYGAGWRDRFPGFEETPLASASIGQVHRATTEEGRVVVLKIQYPGVAESIDSDVDNLASLLGVTRLLPGKLDLDETMRELKRQLRAEADYLNEAECALAYARHVAPLDGITVPQVHPSLSTERTLVMDFVDAPHLFAWASEHGSQVMRDDLARRLIDLTVREMFAFGLAQTDPNFANFLYRPDHDEIVMLDFGACQTVSPEVREVYRRMLSAALDDDWQAMEGGLVGAGYLRSESPEDMRKFFTDLVMTCAEMLRIPGPYDFGQADLTARVKKAMGPAARYQLQLDSPPAHLMFFQRKIAGTYLMCRRLRARVDCHDLCRRVLASCPVS